VPKSTQPSIPPGSAIEESSFGYTTDDPIGRVKCQLAADMDDNLFANILYNPHHVLHKLLPDKTDHAYNLRPRRYSLSLTVKTDCCNFINRLLLKTYISLLLIVVTAFCQLCFKEMMT